MAESYVNRLIKLCEFVLKYGKENQAIYAESFKARLEQSKDLTPRQMQTLHSLIQHITFNLAQIEDMEHLAKKLIKSEESQMALRLVRRA